MATASADSDSFAGPGTFVVFEGPEGAGKSTQVAALAAWLRDRGYHVVVTREPGGTPFGERLRDLVLDDGCAILPEAEALLYAALRAQHVGAVIRPALRTGAVVLCDRFVDSSLAYQVGGRGLDVDDVVAIQRLATGGLRPDLRILLDLPVETGLRRRFSSGEEPNRLDLAELGFHERVRGYYHRLAERAPADWLVIDADRGVHQVHRDIVAGIKRRLAGRLVLAPDADDEGLGSKGHRA